MSKPKKKRLDVLLVERGHAPTRARAQAIILAGAVSLPGSGAIVKAGLSLPEDAEIAVAGDPNPFVSRGGLKLAGALDAFGFDPTGRIAIDVGASTGGFTDCLLQRGAERIYAVDVGYGQLAWKLRSDDRVVVMERTNARTLRPDDFTPRPSLAVCDVSFISATKVLPAVLDVLKPSADLIVMVKPQFEAAPGDVGKGGVIRDESLRTRIIDEVLDDLKALGLRETQRADSEVHGPKGNVECFLWLSR